MKIQIKGYEKGQTIILFAFAIIVLLGFTALAVDGGMIYYERSNAQNAADNTALAGIRAAAEVMANNPGTYDESYFNCASITAAKTAALNAAIAQATVNNFTLTEQNLSTSKHGIAIECNSSGQKYFDVHVRITNESSTGFAHLFFKSAIKNTVDAIARVTPGTSGSMFGGAAIVGLAPSGCGMDFTSSVITTTGGGLFINSNTDTPGSANSALCSNWAPVVNTSGGCIAVVGSAGKNFTNGSQTLGGTDPGFCDPHPAQIAQPNFAAMIPVPPTPPTCSTAGTWNAGTRVATPGSFTSLAIPWNGGTLQSGTYCFSGTFSTAGGPLTVTGGDVIMVFTGSNGAGIGGNVTLNFASLQIYTVNGSWSENGGVYLTVPGVFRFYSTGTGSYNVNGGSVESFSDGFFYLTGGNFGWSGSTNINIIAPTYGPYKGISIYRPVTNTSTLTIMGGSNVNVTGSILSPGATIHLNGSSNATGLNCQIVGNRITTQGGSNMTVNYDPNLNIGAPQPPSIELER